MNRAHYEKPILTDIGSFCCDRPVRRSRASSAETRLQPAHKDAAEDHSNGTSTVIAPLVVLHIGSGLNNFQEPADCERQTIGLQRETKPPRSTAQGVCVQGKYDRAMFARGK